MKGFIHNMVSAHLRTGNIVMPRVKGRFESLAGPLPGNHAGDAHRHSEAESTAGRPSMFGTRHAGNQQPQEVDPGVVNSDEKKDHDAAMPGTPVFAGAAAYNAAHPEAPAFNREAGAMPQDQYQASHANLLTTAAAQQWASGRPQGTGNANSNNEPAAAIGSAEAGIQPGRVSSMLASAVESALQKGNAATAGAANSANDAGIQPAISNAVQQLLAGELSRQPGQQLLQQNLSWLQAFKMKHTGASSNAIVTGEPAASVIKVNIGRIDVRAVTQQAPPRETAAARNKPGVSLSDFLNNKNGSKP